MATAGRRAEPRRTSGSFELWRTKRATGSEKEGEASWPDLGPKDLQVPIWPVGVPNWCLGQPLPLGFGGRLVISFRV